MGWRSIIITQHSKLFYSAHKLVVQTEKGLNQIPIEDIDLLVIATTQAVITSHLISALADGGVKVIFTDERHEPICETVNYYSGSSTLSNFERQYNWNKTYIEKLWTQIIMSKIKNQIQVLEINGRETGSIEEQLSLLEFNDITNREAVVARKYFELLFDAPFTRRNGSVTNRALDYGYAIILSKINQEIVRNGFQTFLGIHHHSDTNQFNLGCDLMEPFRPVVDYWISMQEFDEFTPNIKYSLVDMLNLNLKYNGKHTILRTALKTYVSDCIAYLNQDKQEIKIEVEIPDEVPYNALNDNV